MSIAATFHAEVISRERVGPHDGIHRSTEDVGYAPFAARYRVCLSRSGRWRPAHGWIGTEEGAACAYCECLRDVLVLSR